MYVAILRNIIFLFNDEEKIQSINYMISVLTNDLM